MDIKSQRVKESKGQRVKGSKGQRVKGSKGQRVKKKPIPTPPYERRAEANRVGECLAARRCVIIANLLRCYRIRAWSSPPQRVALTVCPPRKTPPQAGRCFLKRGTRFKKREGRMQARRGAPRGKGRGSRPDERTPPIPDERHRILTQMPRLWSSVLSSGMVVMPSCRIPATSAASACPCCSTSATLSAFPAPPEAMTGMWSSEVRQW